ETALNMALSDLIQVFDISSATVQWLTTGYLLTLGILVPISGLLLQWFTTRGLFFTAVSFSIAGTLIAALSPTFAMLMIGRVVQAVGTALLLPLMF
ncbi:MFS transporter, partial [Listeria monocytogenes]|nr:MFS transporter [Listeria monocytogenes]